MKKQIQLTRDEFREGVFARDGHKCVICKEPAQDAHHILERRLFGDSGGYFIDNGSSLCGKHHIEAEQTTLECHTIREACGIENIVLPDHFYADQEYDKWGNPIIRQGIQRLKGELFYDESVQKILAQGEVLHLFSDYVKYPRSYFVPWGEKVTKDDKKLANDDHFIGKEVVVTIKMDGECLAASTVITMSDGSKRRIIDLVKSNAVGKMVLGQDEVGNVISTPIELVYNNGSAPESDWYKVRVKGSNRPTKNIYCTSGELFFVDGMYKPVTELKIGESVKYHKRCLALSAWQKQVMLGMLLGDASFHIYHQDTAMLQMSHKQAHFEYTEWLMEALGNYSSGNPLSMTAGYGTVVQKNWTRCTRAIFDEFSSMINKEGIKHIPQVIADRIDIPALAIWYMDDGSRLHHYTQQDRVSFATCGFDKKSCENLQYALSKFGLKSSLVLCKGYYQINLNTDSSKRFFELVQEYIPKVMRYKLPDQWRKILPAHKIKKEDSIFYDYTIDSIIQSVENVAHRVERVKYDLQTGTGNLFANDVLVHNCTTMYQDFIHARSINSGPHPTRNKVKEIWSKVGYQLSKDERICGENLYARHSVEYNDLPSYFMVFSWWDGNICQSWDETEFNAAACDLETVPVIYKGIYDQKKIHELYEKEYKGHGCEGYVIRMAGEFTYGQFRMSLMKYVDPVFREKINNSHGHWISQKITPNELK